MAEQWEGGAPEDVLARHKDNTSKNSAAKKFSTVSEPFKSFCQLMWDKHAQISAVAPNVPDNSTTLPQSRKKGAI